MNYATTALAGLLAVPPEERDDAWRANFFRAVPNASLASFDPQIENGPDTFPYFQLAMPDAGPFTPFSIVHILNDVLQNGAGVVIQASTMSLQGIVFDTNGGELRSATVEDLELWMATDLPPTAPSPP
jgi:hypothetical protein